jgi:hypothetical protein
MAADEAEFNKENTPEKAEELEIPTSPPASIPRDTIEYYRAKVELQGAYISAQKEREPAPLKDKVLTQNWYKPMNKATKRRRITQQHGSMRAIGMFEQRLAEEAKEFDKAKKTQDEKLDKRIQFDQCCDGCICEGAECLAAGLTLCTYCHEVKRSKCMIKACRDQREVDPDYVKQCVPKKGKSAEKRKRNPKAAEDASGAEGSDDDENDGSDDGLEDDWAVDSDDEENGSDSSFVVLTCLL